MERRTVLKATILGTLAAAGCSEENPSPHGRPSSPPRPTGPADWNALERGLDGKLVRPSDASYAKARRLYIPRFDRVRPAGIAYCENPQDVSECIAFATLKRMPVAVRCGGHSYAGWSTGTGLVIDVSPMDAVKRDGNHAVVGAGTRLIDLYDKLAADGVSVPSGSCPTVGVAGLTLGGGLGVTSRAYGLSCDVLESVQVVTADGRVLTCDARQNADLFWACRGGGGGNFGVAVSFTFRTHEAGDVTPFSMRWPWSRAADVIRGWQRWAPDAPGEVWTSLHLDTRPDQGTPSIEVTGLALAGAEKHMERLTSAIGADPVSSGARSRPYLDAMKFMGGCAGQTTGQCHGQGDLPGLRADGAFPRTDYSGKSHIAYKPLSDEAIGALLDRFDEGGDVGDRSVLMDAMGAAIARAAPGDTAFPHREGLFCVQYLAPDESWLSGTHDAMEPHLGGAAYVNYIDSGLKDWGRAYYGPNLDRLRKIKAARDPGRLFRFPQAV
ncbi:FAD-binding oxidoreductase [Actinomadura darangshiensis]|uniref:FAD-binding oxidoreductase n=1 Tax=Actinomadura darangshiensis TaxID=705336 RepID=A0A4R5C2C9_9ACTN|nr:FAD-binding oxidoreductase [Actinomadura darangshiensis]TDD92193.1 FAD-binding oxidoreductase [Actinomadura darangshiensis]